MVSGAFARASKLYGHLGVIEQKRCKPKMVIILDLQGIFAFLGINYPSRMSAFLNMCLNKKDAKNLFFFS